MMKAKYYRFIYRSLDGGVWCSGSVAESMEEKEEAFHFLYLGGGSGEKSDMKEQKMTESGDFHLLMIADLRPQTVRQVMETLKKYDADRVLLPAIEPKMREELAEEYARTEVLTEQEQGFVRNPKKYLEEAGVAAVNEIEEREIFQRGNRIFHIFGIGNGRERALVLFHESVDTDPKKEECVMNVKPVKTSGCCSPFVDTQNLNCEMRCMLYNDFTQCKRHNQKNGSCFADGHLIFPAASGNANFGDICSALEKEWEKIRFVCLPDAGWEEEILKVGSQEMARYFMGTDQMEDGVIRKILEKDSYCRVVFLREKSGLCVSGYYVDR